MKDDLVKNYNVSPVKIRKAGLEELESIKKEELLAQTRNSSKQPRGGIHAVS